MLAHLLNAPGETGLSLLDPIGSSSYRWGSFRQAYFTLVNTEVVAIIERDPAESGLYRSRLHWLFHEEPEQVEWIEHNYFPLQQQVVIVHQATKLLSQKGVGEKNAPWLSQPPTSKQLGKLYYLDAATAQHARIEQWTSGEVSNIITHLSIRHTLLFPPD